MRRLKEVGDVAPDFGLRRVTGTGGHEVPVALAAPACAILREYLANERAGQPASAPLLVVTYRSSYLEQGPASNGLTYGCPRYAALVRRSANFPIARNTT